MTPPPSASVAPVWTERGSPRFRRISLALFLAGFATFSLIYSVQPLLPELAADFGIGAAQSSLALSLTTILLALSIFCAAALSEGWGRRGLMFAATGVASGLNIVAAVAPDWTVMLAARALEGLVLGGVPAVAMAYLAEEIHPGSLGATMGLYVGGTALGGMLGRVMVGAITELASWRVALGTLSVVDLAASVGFFLLLPPSRNFVRRTGLDLHYHLSAWGCHLRHPGLALLFALGGLTMGAFVAVYNYVDFRLVAPPYSLSQSQIGLIFTAYLSGIVASPVAGSLADRIGRGPVLVAGIVTSLAGVALTLAHGLAGIIGGIVALTTGFFISHAVASGWVGRLAARARGHASSLYLLTYYVGASLMGSAGGLFWTWGGWTAIALFTGAILTAALAAALALWRRTG